jgi:hypothetical protein
MGIPVDICPREKRECKQKISGDSIGERDVEVRDIGTAISENIS